MGLVRVCVWKAGGKGEKIIEMGVFYHDNKTAKSVKFQKNKICRLKSLLNCLIKVHRQSTLDKKFVDVKPPLGNE